MKYYRLRLEQKSHSDAPNRTYTDYVSYPDNISRRDVRDHYNPPSGTLIMAVHECTRAEYEDFFSIIPTDYD